MKVLNVIVESAIRYHEPDDRRPAQVLATGAQTFPVPEPTETSIPETPSDFILFQVKTSEGKILLQLAVSEYFQLEGHIDGELVLEENRHLRKRPKTTIYSPPEIKSVKR
jgi:hypothetical protein